MSVYRRTDDEQSVSQCLICIAASRKCYSNRPKSKRRYLYSVYFRCFSRSGAWCRPSSVNVTHREWNLSSAAVLVEFAEKQRAKELCKQRKTIRIVPLARLLSLNLCKLPYRDLWRENEGNNLLGLRYQYFSNRYEARAASASVSFHFYLLSRRGAIRRRIGHITRRGTRVNRKQLISRSPHVPIAAIIIKVKHLSNIAHGSFRSVSPLFPFGLFIQRANQIEILRRAAQLAPNMRKRQNVCSLLMRSPPIDVNI